MKNLYNICITILEARYLPWINNETYVVIEVDGKRKRTKVKECSDRPFYNEYFVFEVKKSFSDLMSTNIIISMYRVPKKLFQKKFVATIKMDIGTIWNKKDHQFHHEWLTLRYHAKEKGFLRCDIRILAPDLDSVHRSPSIQPFSRSQNLAIEESAVNKMAVYITRIYRGGDMYNLSNKLEKPKISVGVTFYGISVKTSEYRNTINPVWNEEFKFLSPFPPAHHKLKLDLLVNNKEVSSISILIDEISCTFDKNKGFLPTFGPAHKYFYSPENVYLGYVILSLETIETKDGRESDKPKDLSKRVQIFGFIEEKHFGFQYMACFCLIYELSMLNKEVCSGRALSVSMEIGREGLFGIDNEVTVTPPIIAVETDGNYCWVPFGKRKPCLFIKDMLPDTRWRLFMTNSLIKVYTRLEENLSLVDKEELTSDKLNLIINALKILKRDCENVKFSSGTTQLDKERPRFLRNLLYTISTDASEIMKWDKFKKMYHHTREILNLLKKFMKDPQDSLPSIIFNVWTQNKRIYTCRVPPEDVLYANNPDFCGSSCGQLKVILLEEIGSKYKDFGAKMSKIKKRSGKMVVYMWLGVLNDMNHWHDSVPDGFTFCPAKLTSSFVERNSMFSIAGSSSELNRSVYVPTCINYNVFFDCICHVYIGQAHLEKQSLFDSPGSYKVKVIFKNRSAETREIFGMQQLVWSELLSTAPVAMYGSKSYYEEHQPPIIIEVWQRKKKLLLVGNVCLNVKLRNITTDKDVKELESCCIIDESTMVGKLFLYAELIEVNEETRAYRPASDSSAYSNSALTTLYRLELYFWGVRDLKYQSDDVCVRVTVGTYSVSSPSLRSQKGCVNFLNDRIFTKDMILPKSRQFSPMMIIDLVDTFESKINKYAGCCAINDIHEKFGYNFITQEEWEKIQIPPVSGSMISLKRPLNLVEITSERHSKHNILKNCKFNLERKDDLTYKEHLAEAVLKVPKEETNDWWSKYFSGKQMVEKSSKEKIEDKKITEYIIPKEPALEFYTGELEQEFDGFTDLLKVFNLTQLGTKEIPVNDHVCKVKAAVVLYEVPTQEENVFTRNGNRIGNGRHVLTNIAPSIPIRLLLRIYVVQAYNLFSRLDLAMNPYIIASVPSASVKNFAAYLADQSNPCFGLSFELVAELPTDYELTIKVMNSIRFGKDEMIGETKIDLENRYFTKHRARCGLQTIYSLKGLNCWRDQFKPSEILENLCDENNINQPIYLPNSIIVAGREFSFPMFVSNVKEVMALHILLRWEEIPVVGCKLVREHVETRPLYKPDCPGIIQGYLEMWVDIFDSSGPPPLAPLLSITPREPQSFELRVIIYRTSRVILIDDDLSVGYKHSDIYVKGWMLGKSDTQSTDVHFRSMTGDGNFNWRFIFPFKYLPTEQCITLSDTQTSSKKKVVLKIPPRIYLQVCDKELMLPDQFIGMLSLDLRYMIKGASRWWRCKSYVDESPKNTLNLFEEKKTRGWWAFYGSQRFKQKNKITGYLEAEFHLVSYFEALRSPVGYGRNEPESLPEPKRKALKHLFWLLPCRVCMYMIGLNKGTILLVLAILGVILFVLLGIYAIPSTVVHKIFGLH